MFPLATESAGSSPTKSPNPTTMPAGPTDRRRRQPAAQGTPVPTPVRATTFAEETQYASAWNIPALRTPGIEAAPSRHLQGPAAKMSRRQAWLKFLAYEGAVQVCLDALLQGGEDASPAAGFLTEGCAALKSALHLYNITLPPADDSQKDAVVLYWYEKMV
jgi:hypothetical protein